MPDAVGVGVTLPSRGGRRDPGFFALPGFLPDAMGFALRFTAALLLAYLIAFHVQLDAAASAGVCVAIVTQASPGMAMSKMVYRIAGTVVGGVAALCIVSAFAQDRSALLAAFTLFLGLCTFVAALLRDFRSYGAVLCGYTVGIIAVSGIDTPDGALLATLNRVAAILIGVFAVALVNGLFSPGRALDGLLAGLEDDVAQARALAGAAAAGRPLEDAAYVALAADALALTTEATYAATELPDGSARSAGARAAIAAMLGMLSASRAVARGMRAAPSDARAGFLTERREAVRVQEALAEDGLARLRDGGRVRRPVTLRVHHDLRGAARTAARTVIAVGLGSVFCVYAGWPGATGLLVQQAAFTALLGMQPNPTRAGLNMTLGLPVAAVSAGVVGLGVLPLVSGFVPFALAVGAAAFVTGLLARHRRLAEFGPGLLLYFVLLLAPANTPVFDLAAYLNTLMVQAVALVFLLASFRVLLPVSRRHRFARVVGAVSADLRRTWCAPRPLDEAAAQSLQYDRVAQARLWLGARSPARLAVLHRAFAFAELDIALRRAWSAVTALTDPAFAEAAAQARQALTRPRPGTLGRAGESLGACGNAAGTAASGLYGAELLLTTHWRALRRYGVRDEGT